jgi:lipopolysaccharide/colanic/teichoic acid biosynthesis glycosyltransferase
VATLRSELESEVLLRERLAAVRAREKTLQLAAKRALDIVGSLLLLVLLFVPGLIVALIIRLDSPGAPLLRQERVGRDGKRFRMWKFRTMCDRAHEMQHELSDLNEHDGRVFKIRNDPRRTRVGTFLRKMSVDEFPQLLNVLAGDMSLVGPRPPFPSEVLRYSERHLGRLAMKPGMTGLWQVSGRSNLPFEQMVDLDLRYIRDWSLLADLSILARTLPAVITARGAF